MAGLVADYDSESDVEDPVSLPSPISNETPLPKPNFNFTGSDDSMKCSVFMNPFVEADNAKTAILEKHVKMISADVNTVNVKRVCWNYIKKKCRFGHNCKYAHDSDLQTDKSMITESERNVKQIDLKKVKLPESSDEHTRSPEQPLRKKKRPGLCQGITPSKKVMKLYNQQKKKS